MRRNRYFRRVPRKAYQNPRLERIKLHARDVNEFCTEVLDREEHTDSIRRMRELLRYTPQHILSHPKFHSRYGHRLTSLLEEKISSKKKVSYYSSNYEKPHSYEYPELIIESQDYIDDQAKSKIVSLIVSYHKNFYSQAKRQLAAISINFMQNGDERATDVLRAFYRSLKPDAFSQLMEKIDGGTENEKVKEILSKTKLFDYLKYPEDKVKNDAELKTQLIRDIAQTPSIAKRLNYVVDVSIDDIKKLPPVTKFKFLQNAFKYETMYSGYTWYSKNDAKMKINRARARHKEDKLNMPYISGEEMGEILFSISLHKNDELNKWLDRYKNYLKVMA